jgi:hypothetical protein
MLEDENGMIKNQHETLLQEYQKVCNGDHSRAASGSADMADYVYDLERRLEELSLDSKRTELIMQDLQAENERLHIVKQEQDEIIARFEELPGDEPYAEKTLAGELGENECVLSDIHNLNNVYFRTVTDRNVFALKKKLETSESIRQDQEVLRKKMEAVGFIIFQIMRVIITAIHGALSEEFDDGDRTGQAKEERQRAVVYTIYLQSN